MYRDEIDARVAEAVKEKASELAFQRAEEDYALGCEIRQYWGVKARQAGMELRDYVNSALIFYEENKEEVERMREQIEVAHLVVDKLFKEDIVKQKKMELYYKFARYCMHMKSKGMRITPEVLDSFWHDLACLEKGVVKLPNLPDK